MLPKEFKSLFEPGQEKQHIHIDYTLHLSQYLQWNTMKIPVGLWGGEPYSYFIDEWDTAAQRDNITYPRSCYWKVAEPELKLRSAGSWCYKASSIEHANQAWLKLVCKITAMLTGQTTISTCLIHLISANPPHRRVVSIKCSCTYGGPWKSVQHHG